MREPQTASEESIAAEQIERIFLIKHWLQELTLLASDAARARQLQHHIETNLDVLMRGFQR